MPDRRNRAQQSHLLPLPRVPDFRTMSLLRTSPDHARVAVADLRAGFMVFLIALPLCLGIAIASGFPPVAGVVTAIVGGLVSSPLGSARLTIKGPAAGLIAIAIGSVMELGQGDLAVGYHKTLAVGVVAAAIQIVFALLRTATIGIAISPSVVQGMLAAIGVIIISKQVHTVLGVTPTSKTPFGLLAEIPHSVMHCNPMVLALGASSLLILFGWQFLKARWAKGIPAQLVVLAVAIPMGLLCGLSHAHDYEFFSTRFHVGPEFLVQLPGSLIDVLAFPDFSTVWSAASLKYIAMFALVGTLESTLSVIAVDALDPEKRSSDLDRDLLATGVGNLVAASIGGLPMISEIVRSRANIDAGARSSLANFSHGALLLLFVAVAPGLLETIPLAALGAMLVYTGTRLASPSGFHRAFHIGLDQLVLFATTFFVTLATDLLIGIGAGFAMKVVLHFVHGGSLRNLVRPHVDQVRHENRLVLKVHGAAAFTSLLPVNRILSELDESITHVTIDLSEVAIADHTFFARIHAIADEMPGKVLAIVGIEDMEPFSAHPHASRGRDVS